MRASRHTIHIRGEGGRPATAVVTYVEGVGATIVAAWDAVGKRELTLAEAKIATEKAAFAHYSQFGSYDQVDAGFSGLYTELHSDEPPDSARSLFVLKGLEPVPARTILEWAEFMDSDRVLARDVVGDFTVITRFTGIGSKLFETVTTTSAGPMIRANRPTFPLAMEQHGRQLNAIPRPAPEESAIADLFKD